MHLSRVNERYRKKRAQKPGLMEHVRSLADLLNLTELDDKSLKQAFLALLLSAWCAFPTAAELVKELLTWLGFLTLQEIGRNLI